MSVGDSLGSCERTATRVGMFLFGVAHWTAHRIHYDTEWARREGYPDVLVPGPLMSAWQVELVDRLGRLTARADLHGGSEPRARAPGRRADRLR